MSLDQFRHRVTSAEQLESLIGSPSELVIRKQLSQLDHHMQAFIAEAPFALLGTYGRDGQCDVSPRGDRPSVAQVIDPKTLVLAERPGNRRADSLQNIIETGRVGLLFVIPGLGETLRVNGAACVIQDEEVLATLAVQGKQPVIGIAVEVEECYLQCAKALIRSKLWEPPQPLKTPSLSCFAEILIDQTDVDETVESLDEQIQQSYSERLY
ncbi:MAG: PPOX class probable FMN-dependent enzyme [Planctomycetaceae bacterium]|jgi:PPOX class probable FMN-dependent enzyme